MSKVHGGLWEKRDDGYDHCHYCGSISPKEALRRMATPGCRFSGTDKGGYKFYFDSETGHHGKFYGEHLADLTKEELEEFAAVSRRVLGVDWVFTAGRGPLCYMPRLQSFYGWQTYGHIDQDGKPVFAEHAPVPPDEAWWEVARTKRAPVDDKG